MRTLIFVMLLVPTVAVANPKDGPCLREFDLKGDGSTDERIRYIYAGQDRCFIPPDIDLIGCPSRDESLAADGKVTRMRIFSYNAQGNLTTLAYVHDGEVSTTLTFTYDKDGKLAKMDSDQGGGNRYTQGKDQITREQFAVTGDVIRKVTYKLNKDGLVVASEVDHGADGSINVRTQRTYTGKRANREEMKDGAGKLLGVTTWKYDCSK